MLSRRSLQVNIGWSEQPQREESEVKDFLVVQWLRILPPMQGMWVQSLVWELRSHMCCAVLCRSVMSISLTPHGLCNLPGSSVHAVEQLSLHIETREKPKWPKKKKKKNVRLNACLQPFSAALIQMVIQRERLLQLWKTTSQRRPEVRVWLECSRIIRKAEWLPQRKQGGEGKETDQTDNGFSKSRASCRGWKDSDAFQSLSGSPEDFEQRNNITSLARLLWLLHRGSGVGG